MIWVIANKKEEDGSFPTYKYYKQAFPEGEIDIYLATPQDNFAFLHRGDIAIVRTRDQRINERLRVAKMAYGFATTGESSKVDWLTHDKEAIKVVLAQNDIIFPRTVELSDVVRGRKYFVKPRYGENSIGVDPYSICTNQEQVHAKCQLLWGNGIEPMIEEYIDGDEVTTSVFWESEEVHIAMYSALMRPNEECGLHTKRTKEHFAFTPERYISSRLNDVIRKTFHAVGATHLLRIDSRIVNGVPYIIDVNMIPGLAPDGYLSKCMEVNDVPYLNAIRMMVGTAT